jgi:hypothetical protein
VGDRDLFHDVESINQALGEEKETYRLFLTMLKTSPLLAPTCADLALVAIVKAADFRLAERHSELPEDALIRYSDQLNKDVADVSRYRERKTHVLDAYVHIYCDRVGTAIAILKGLGKADEAVICREWAEVLVESATVRKGVQKKFEERYDA